MKTKEIPSLLSQFSLELSEKLWMNLSITVQFCVYDTCFIQFTLSAKKRFAAEAALLGILDYTVLLYRRFKTSPENYIFLSIITVLFAD